MGYLRGIAAIYWKDLVLELRTRQSLSAMLVFCLTVAVLFNFAFEPGSSAVQAVAPGVLWSAFAFAGILGISRSFSFEVDRGGLQGLLLCPVERGVIYFAKVLGNFSFMLLVEIIALPVFVILYDLPLSVNLGALAAVLVAGTLGFSAVGSLLSAMSASTRAREILLPVLLFPVAVPLLIATVKSTGPALTGRPIGEIAVWLRLLIAFDLLFLAVSSLTFEYVVED
ncbi:MAG: heme exporter protein CcmB [candidate division KSB1 bacterium]|nr:heme exporter protein CcmB [candidate division KSB1 bacterium]